MPGERAQRYARARPRVLDSGCPPLLGDEDWQDVGISGTLLLTVDTPGFAAKVGTFARAKSMATSVDQIPAGDHVVDRWQVRLRAET
jgi:hypothetical protein